MVSDYFVSVVFSRHKLHSLVVVEADHKDRAQADYFERKEIVNFGCS